MSVLVKICGLSDADAVDAALAAGADMVGFVFFAPSPRHVAFPVAQGLGQQVRGRAQKVALTVDATEAFLDRIVDVLQPDLLQLHGRETPARVRAVGKRYGLAVMKAIPVEGKADIEAANDYASVAERLLFDARAPREATRPGGLGRPFDWTLLADLGASLPFMLSGGLAAGNVGEALRITRAAGVDVSSGVERSPGIKDPDRIRAFVTAVRQAETNIAKSKA
jgi:phosphoribosylanthranilate isomerase